MSPVDIHLGEHPRRPGTGRRQRFERWLVGSPGMAWSVLIVVGLTAVLALVMIGMSRRVLVTAGQVMDHTRMARVPIEVADHAATEAERRRARERTPSVLMGTPAVIEEVVASVRDLPVVLAGKEKLEDVPVELRQRFGLSEGAVAEIRRHAVNAEPSALWARRAERLGQLLRSTPLVDRETYQWQARSGSDQVELVLGEGEGGSAVVRAANMVSTDNRLLETDMRMLAVKAGFTGEALDAVTTRLAAEPAPTFTMDRRRTQEKQDRAAAAVPLVSTRLEPGRVLYARGEVLSTQALSEVQAEEAAYRVSAPAYQRLSADAGLAMGALLTALGLGAYLGAFAPGIMGRPRRLAALCGLFAGALIVSCGVALVEPRLMAAALVVPAVFLAAVLVVAYERRTALAVGSLLATALTLQQPIEGAVLSLFGVGLMVWQLREIRQRGVLIRAGFVAGALTAGVALCIAPLRRPLVDAAIPQMLLDAGSVGAGVLLVGFVVLGLLPTIERAFGVVTALSLIELRDPSHPLLRQLQQRAPGTYSHSMNVATLSETAAQAIGADGLLAYVGSLYHDVGKMNRPEFFVENQGGINRHDKLPPAMSTLMIVSHVADGLQLAREYNLPRPLHHFIESHHGTTMVEFFFPAQKLHDQRALDGDGAGTARQWRSGGG